VSKADNSSRVQWASVDLQMRPTQGRSATTS
jgi:hypothetical protein